MHLSTLPERCHQGKAPAASTTASATESLNFTQPIKQNCIVSQEAHYSYLFLQVLFIFFLYASCGLDVISCNLVQQLSNFALYNVETGCFDANFSCFIRLKHRFAFSLLFICHCCFFEDMRILCGNKFQGFEEIQLRRNSLSTSPQKPLQNDLLVSREGNKKPLDRKTQKVEFIFDNVSAVAYKNKSAGCYADSDGETESELQL